MTPLATFEQVCARCDLLSAIHAYLAANASGALQPDEVLRAEWVARVSALDLYVHELVAQRMVLVHAGKLAATAQFNAFKIKLDTVDRIRAAPSVSDALSAFDLDVRTQLSFVTYQDPDKIAEGIRLVSSSELWNEIAIHQGATSATKTARAKGIRSNLSAIVSRRNKIAHEGDLQPSIPRTPWPVSQNDLNDVRVFIERLVRSIDSVIW